MRGGFKMRQVLNFFITEAILWFISDLSPHFIRIDDWQTLVIATIIVFVIDTTICLVLMSIMKPYTSPARMAVYVIFSMIAAMLVGTVTILVINAILPGFWIRDLVAALTMSFFIAISTPNLKISIT